MNSYAPLEPSLVLLSTLGSFPFAVYCIRFIGMAAFHVKRDAAHMPVAIRLNERWANLLLQFLVAAAIAAPLVWTVEASAGAFVAVLVGTVWPHATHRTSRAVLLLYAAGTAYALVASGAGAFAEVVSACLIGMGAVVFTTCVLRLRS